MVFEIFHLDFSVGYMMMDVMAYIMRRKYDSLVFLGVFDVWIYRKLSSSFLNPKD